MIYFTWDEKKNHQNKLKHKVSFEEAQSVFYDDFAVQFYDDAHSENEERFLLLGKSWKQRILFVVHCERSDDEIRIISARKATTKEKQEYGG